MNSLSDSDFFQTHESARPRSSNPVFISVSKHDSGLAHIIKDSLNSSLVFSSSNEFIIVMSDSGDGGCALWIDNKLTVTLTSQQPDLSDFFPLEDESTSDSWYESQVLSPEDIENVSELNPQTWGAMVRRLAPFYDVDQVARRCDFKSKLDIYNHTAQLGKSLISDGCAVLGLSDKAPVAGMNSKINNNRFAAAEKNIDWRKHMTARAVGGVDGVGLATGQGRYIVLDLDTGPDGEPIGYENLLEALGMDELPDCPIVKTPSGGLHLFFEDINGITVSAGRIGAKIDIRGSGGFVVAAGTFSQKRGAFYHWVPSHSIHEKALGKWPDRLLFAAMFNEHDKRALSVVGINSHADLANVLQSEWKAYTDKKIADYQDSPEQKRIHEQRNKRLKSLTIEQATDINNLAAVELRNLAADLVDMPLESGSGKNHRLFLAARSCGALLEHDITSKKLTESEVIDVLLSATEGWVDHDQYSRKETILSGVKAGRADIALGDASQGASWINKKIDRCLGRGDRVNYTGRERGSNIRITCTVAEARVELAQRVSDFIDGAKDFHKRNEVLALKDKRGFPQFMTQQVDVGAGKTKILIDSMVEELPFLRKEEKEIIYFVPTHKLAEEVRERFIESGALEDDVAVYRGRSAPNPEKDDEQACLKAPEADLISKNGGSVSEILCKECPFADVCFWQKQKNVKPRVWIVPHALLSVDASPESADNVLPTDPYLIFIDESYAHSHVVPAKRDSRIKQMYGPKGNEVEINQPDPYRLLSEHRQQGCPIIYEKPIKGDTKRYTHYELSSLFEELRAKVNRLALICKDSYVTKGSLDEVGLSREDLDEAYKLEIIVTRQAREMESNFWTGSYESSIEEFYLSHCHYWHNLWRALSNIASEPEAPTTIPDELKRGDEGAVYCHANGDFTIGYVKPLADRWSHSPTLHVDATPVGDELARAVATFRYKRLEPIAITTPNQHVTAVVGTATGKKHVEKKANAFGVSIAADLFKHGTDPKKALVITHKSCVEKLKQSLPEGVAVKWFGGIRGLDTYGGFDALYVIGGPNPNELQIAGHIETTTGHELVGVNGCKQKHAIELRDGRLTGESGFAYSKLHSVDVHAHSSGLARDYVAEVREAEMIQAIGRLRGINRTEDNKARIVVIGDYVLPIEYDSIAEFTAWAATPFDAMERAGLTPVGYRTAYKIYPYLWETEASCDHEYRVTEESNVMREPYKEILLYSSRIGFDSSTKKIKAIVSEHVDQKDLSALVVKLSGGEYAMQEDRDPKIAEFMDRFGFISLSPAHNHMLAKDLFTRKESSKNVLKLLTPEAGEVVVEYRLAKAGSRIVSAIVRAESAEKALCIISSHMNMV